MQSRQSLEREADYLGVPFTHTTTDAELQALIESRHGGLTAMANGAGEAAAAEANGGVEDCHGILWDFPESNDCQKCADHQSCFRVFAQQRYPFAVEKLGAEAPLERYAENLGVSEKAVLLAKSQQATPPVLSAPPLGPPSVPEVEQYDPLEDESLDEFEAESVSEKSGSDLNTDEFEDEPEGESEPELENGVVVKKTGKKKAAKKKAAKKKVVKKVSGKKKGSRKKKAAKAPPPVSSEAQDPPPAESAKTATGSASTNAEATCAPSAKVQADQSKNGAGTKGKGKKLQNKRRRGVPDDPWGRQTWSKRWGRERQHRLIKLLRPGMKLIREYPKQSGVFHEVIVLKKYYKYKGKEYPTLYTIAKEIMGTRPAPRQLNAKGRRPEGMRNLAPCSAIRFFALKALFPSS
jgi:hypothetical protein